MIRNDGTGPVGPALLIPLLLVVGGSGVAVAGEGDGAAARALFAEARRLAAGGDYGAACPKFEESLRLDPGIGTSFNLADCLQHLGRTASAWARFLDVAAVTKAAGQPDRERVARARAAALAPELSRLVVEVRVPDPGITIQRDGVAVTTAAWGVAVPVDPGVHLVEAQAPSKKTWSARVTVPPGAATVVVAIPALEAALAAPGSALSSDRSSDRSSARPPPGIGPPAGRSAAPGRAIPQVAATPPPSPAHRWKKTTIALASVGLAGVVFGGVFGAKYLSAHADARSICPSSIDCTPEEKTRHDALVDEERSDLTLEIAGAGVGALAVVAAAYLWTRPAAATPAAAPRFSLRPLTLARTAGVDLAMSW